jgi:hypothetical protein
VSPAQKAITEEQSLSDLHHAFEKRRVRGEAQQDTGMIGSGKALAVLCEQCPDLPICYEFIHQRQIGGRWRRSAPFELLQPWEQRITILNSYLKSLLCVRPGSSAKT